MKSLEKGFWEGGFRLKDPPPTKYYIKNAPSDEKDASESGASKAPRVEATASFEEVFTVPTRRPRRDF